MTDSSTLERTVMPGPSTTYDVIAIGAGQAGPIVGLHLASLGKKVALIERDRIGGTCLNVGCRPTKALRASARAVHVAQNSQAHGLTVGSVNFDFSQAMSRMTSMIDNWRTGVRDLARIRPQCGADPRPRRVRRSVGGRLSSRRRGSSGVGEGRGFGCGHESRVPSIPGLSSIDYFTNETIFALRDLPDHLVIVGGSYIGLEFAQIFRRFGSRVTVVERGPRIAAQEDDDVSAEIRKVLEREGIAIRTSSGVESVRPASAGLEVVLDSADVIGASHLLIAVGRTPNTDQLGLETIGLEVDDRGFIPTDGTFHTAVEGVVALGDVNGRGGFTHTAYQDGEIYIDHLSGGGRTVDDRIPTYALFTDPPLGRVGMNDRQAGASGRRVLRAVFPMKSLTKSVLEAKPTA